jgi:hypothetical protein
MIDISLVKSIQYEWNNLMIKYKKHLNVFKTCMVQKNFAVEIFRSISVELWKLIYLDGHNSKEIKRNISIGNISMMIKYVLLPPPPPPYWLLGQGNSMFCGPETANVSPRHWQQGYTKTYCSRNSHTCSQYS